MDGAIEWEDEAPDTPLWKPFAYYAAYGATAFALVVLARRAHGPVRTVLLGLAALLGAATVWSVAIMGPITLAIRWARRRGEDVGFRET